MRNNKLCKKWWQWSISIGYSINEKWVFFIISNIVESKYELLFIHPSFLLDLLIIIDHDWKMYFSFLSILFIIPIGMNFCFDNTIEWDVRNKIRHVELISRKRFHQHNTFVIKTKTKKRKIILSIFSLASRVMGKDRILNLNNENLKYESKSFIRIFFLNLEQFIHIFLTLSRHLVFWFESGFKCFYYSAERWHLWRSIAFFSNCQLV